MHIRKTYSLLVATSLQLAAASASIPMESPSTEEIEYFRSLVTDFSLPSTSSPSPTNSPVSMPWEIEFLDLATDFSVDSDDEVVLTYSVGKRPYETQLLAKDCESPITGIDITLDDSSTPDDATHELLSLAYSFDKSAIANSNIWDSDSKMIELCQVIQLIIPAAGPSSPKMVIAEDIREIEIEFDLSVDYEIESDLGEAAIDSDSGSTNVTSYLSSCKCGGGQNFTCDSEPLFPNAVLHVCIKSISPDVEIDFLDSMDVSQGSTLLPVIVDDAVSVPSITQREYVPAENGVVVSTRIPTNLFDYDVGNSLSISGEVDTKLVGDSSRRRLQSTTDSANENEYIVVSPYGFEVVLQKEQEGMEEDTSTNSGSAIAAMGAATFGAMLLLV